MKKRLSVSELLKQHQNEESVVLHWIDGASVRELMEFAVESGKSAFTMSYVKYADRKLLELHTKPHWSIVPTFALVIVGIIISVAAWLLPRAPVAPKEGSNTVKAPSPSLPQQPQANTVTPVPVLAPQSLNLAPVATPTTQQKTE